MRLTRRTKPTPRKLKRKRRVLKKKGGARKPDANYQRMAIVYGALRYSPEKAAKFLTYYGYDATVTEVHTYYMEHQEEIKHERLRRKEKKEASVEANLKVALGEFYVPKEEEQKMATKKTLKKKKTLNKVSVKPDKIKKAAKTTTKKVVQKAAKKTGKGRIEFLGHAVTAVLRRLGKEGVSSADAIKIMKKSKVAVADTTVRIQISAGATGQRGDPAAITGKQVKELKASVK